MHERHHTRRQPLLPEWRATARVGTRQHRVFDEAARFDRRSDRFPISSSKHLGFRSVQHVVTHDRDIQQTPQPLDTPPLPRRLTRFLTLPYTPRLETRTAKRRDWFAVAQQTSRSPPFPQTPAPGPVSFPVPSGRVEAERAADFDPRLVSVPGLARFGSRPGIRPGCRFGCVVTLRSPTRLPERLPTRGGVRFGKRDGALWGGCRYGGRGGKRGGGR